MMRCRRRDERGCTKRTLMVSPWSPWSLNVSTTSPITLPSSDLTSFLAFALCRKKVRSAFVFLKPPDQSPRVKSLPRARYRKSIRSARWLTFLGLVGLSVRKPSFPSCWPKTVPLGEGVAGESAPIKYFCRGRTCDTPRRRSHVRRLMGDSGDHKRRHSRSRSDTLQTR
jgi:hypothetical protein